MDIKLEQVALGPTVAGSDAHNGLITSTIGGFQTPNDPTPTPQNADTPAQMSRGDDYLATDEIFHTASQGRFTNLRQLEGEWWRCHSWPLFNIAKPSGT